MADPAPNPELLRTLGRVVRGLSALFWGLPLALIVCVQTARGDLLRPLGIVPPLLLTGMLLYALNLLAGFQPQERIWHIALDRARLFALVNVGLSPFLYWWNKLPSHPFFSAIVYLLMFTGLLFLFMLNPVLWRLAAMLPDETLRVETRLFTTVNRYLLLGTLLITAVYLGLARVQQIPEALIGPVVMIERRGLWLVLFSVLLPTATTMALIWKTKEVIFSSVFGPSSREE